jgi:hypothetical protein
VLASIQCNWLSQEVSREDKSTLCNLAIGRQRERRLIERVVQRRQCQLRQSLFWVESCCNVPEGQWAVTSESGHKSKQVAECERRDERAIARET